MRRGYFVAGLGAAQFALPGAVDRLRAARDELVPSELRTVAATDPAQPYGAALAWPTTGAGHPARAAGARVVLWGGRPLGFLERGGRRLRTFPVEGADTDDTVAARSALAAALGRLVGSGRVRSLELTEVDGVPTRESPLVADLREAGFVDGYRGLVLRMSRR